MDENLQPQPIFHDPASPENDAEAKALLHRTQNPFNSQPIPTKRRAIKTPPAVEESGGATIYQFEKRKTAITKVDEDLGEIALAAQRELKAQ